MLRGSSASASLWVRPDHPNAGEAWWQDIAAGREQPGGGALRYDPFRGWWGTERRSRYVNVDGRGRRVTLQPAIDSRQPRVVYMFGGSAMWGWLVRDSSTIPSLVATRLHAMAYTDVEVQNLAQSTYDLAQNAATLWQELRHGRVPVVAVFLDGNNEVAPVFQSGTVGAILNQSLIARRFDRRTDFRSDAMALLRHSELVQRLTQRTPAAQESYRSLLCGAVAGSYARQVEMFDGISTSNGFRSVFFWQPMRATTGKRQTSWERQIGAGESWSRMIRQCTKSVDSALARLPSLLYVPLHALFNDHSETIFLDDYGHMTEQANRIVADRVAGMMAEKLGPPVRSEASGAPKR